MSERPTVDVSLLGGLLRQVQADQRTLRTSVDMLVRNSITRTEVLNGFDAIGQRIASFEASIEARFDELRESNTRIEMLLADIASWLPK